MSKLEKIINSNNNAYVLSNLRLKKSNLYSKSISNKNKSNQKIKFPSKTKDNNNKNKLSKIIVDFFKKINEMDNNIEIIRSKLYLSSNFSEKKLFSVLDRNSKNFLTLNDFKLFLKDNKITFTEKILRKFIHNFDKNKDFCLNFEEFLGIISPKKNNIIPNQKNEKDFSSEELQKIFCELLNQELKFVEKYSELTEKIRKHKEFSPIESFKEIVGEEKYINNENLKKFLTNKGVKLEENEINQLLFRIDKDNDGMVSYEEFKDIFSPLNNSEVISPSNRDYNRDFFSKYDIDDEKENKNLNENNFNNNIINNDDINYNNNNLPLKINNKFHYKENKENNKNSKNLSKAEQRYNLNLESDFDNINMKKKYRNNRNFMTNNDLESSISNSIYLYKEKMKNGKTENENNTKDYSARYKSVNNYHTTNNNNLLELTKSILGIYPNNILTKIRVNSNTNKINKNNINPKKKIIEIEYESNYNVENFNKNNKKENKNNNENMNKTNPDPISDSILNYDYSRYTYKENHNGPYFFKKRNKGEIVESNTTVNNINIISDNESNNNNTNTNNTTINKEHIIMRKNGQNKNINKTNSFTHEYNYEDKFSFKDGMDLNNKKNNIRKNKDIHEYQNQTFDKINFKKKNSNLYFNYDNENDINKSDFDSNINNNNINNNNFYARNEEKYLDSLENINQEKKDKSLPIYRNPKNLYHYNTKLKKNFLRNDIQSQSFLGGKTNNNYNFRFNKKNNLLNNINKEQNQNLSHFIPSSNSKNDLFNIGQENLNPNIYKINPNNNKKIANHNYSSNSWHKNNLFQIDFEDNKGNIHNNINKKYNNNKRNIKKINKNRNKVKNSKNNSLPKTYYTNRDNNNLNIDYSMDNISQNISPINNNISNRNFRKKNMNIYKFMNNAPKKVYRNSHKMNNNFNANNSFYYLESSYNNDNFMINQINSSVQKDIKKKNYITYNLKRNTPNKYSDLYNLFHDFIQQDNSIEEKRQLLSSREDANLIDLFSLFNFKGNRMISSSDFIQTLNQLGLNTGKDDMKYLFRKFNKKLNESFDFDEFSEIILPKKYSNEKIMDIEKRDNNYRNRRIGDDRNKKFIGISMTTKKLLRDLFKNVIEGEKSNEDFRKILAKNEEISVSDLFNKIKKNYSVGIYKEDIANFMKKNDYKLNNKEIELLMERFDKNKNGIIDYKEFMLEIAPINGQFK